MHIINFVILKFSLGIFFMDTCAFYLWKHIFNKKPSNLQKIK